MWRAGQQHRAYGAPTHREELQGPHVCDWPCTKFQRKLPGSVGFVKALEDLEIKPKYQTLHIRLTFWIIF